MDDLLARHRKEKKDLQSRITQKKKSANKKTRKGVNDECDLLERELKEKHEAEVAALNGDAVTEDTADDNTLLSDEKGQDEKANGPAITSNEATEAVEKNMAALDIAPDSQQQPSQSARKPNRNKARLARREAKREALVNEAADEASYLPDLKARERERMLSEFKTRGLQEKEIRADGHCLYSAIATGLRQHDISLIPRASAILDSAASTDDSSTEDYRTVRRTAAAYMTCNADDFAPFLEEDLKTYVHKVADTGEWGGQLELLALAKAYGVDISVLQGDGRIEEISGEGTDGEKKRIWLAYYKHGFGLGEHYNSLREEDSA